MMYEIGSFLALDGSWQQLDKIRILIDTEVTHATRAAFCNDQVRGGCVTAGIQPYLVRRSPSRAAEQALQDGCLRAARAEDRRRCR